MNFKSTETKKIIHLLIVIINTNVFPLYSHIYLCLYSYDSTVQQHGVYNVFIQDIQYMFIRFCT